MHAWLEQGSEDELVVADAIVDTDLAIASYWNVVLVPIQHIADKVEASVNLQCLSDIQAQYADSMKDKTLVSYCHWSQALSSSLISPNERLPSGSIVLSRNCLGMSTTL